MYIHCTSAHPSHLCDVIGCGDELMMVCVDCYWWSHWALLPSASGAWQVLPGTERGGGHTSSTEPHWWQRQCDIRGASGESPQDGSGEYAHLSLFHSLYVWHAAMDFICVSLFPLNGMHCVVEDLLTFKFLSLLPPPLLCLSLSHLLVVLQKVTSLAQEIILNIVCNG